MKHLYFIMFLPILCALVLPLADNLRRILANHHHHVTARYPVVLTFSSCFMQNMCVCAAFLSHDGIYYGSLWDIAR